MTTMNEAIDNASEQITAAARCGSSAAPGFMDPEGIVIYHTAGNFGLKKTFKKDAEGKGR